MSKQESEDQTVQWNTPVPAGLSDAAAERMSTRGFNSKAEYVRALIRADVEKAALDELEGKLLRAMRRGNFTEDSPELWDRLRSEVFGKD